MNTVIGEFVLPGNGWVWTQALLQALALFGVDEAAIRQALSRSAAEGLLEREQDGRRVRWRVAALGRKGAAEAAERIYTFQSGQADWDGRWLLLDVQVPDDLLRLRLRRRLAWAGFGALPSGLAITPHVEREIEARRILEALGLQNSAVSFTAKLATIGVPKSVITGAWDLDDLGLQYGQFIDDVAEQRPRTDEDVFVAHARLVHEWRRFPFVDPGLPVQFLPRDWVGLEAKKVFDKHYARWRPAAGRWFAERNAG